jgi:enhancing lycopene biosynthesis protein 2
MAKRIGVVLSGCGGRDGSDVAEALLTLLVIERAGAEAVCAAPDVDQPLVVDHLSGRPGQGPRNARTESARIAGQPVLSLSELTVDAIDGLVIPGGEGNVVTLSDYAVKHEVCQVHPDVTRLLRGMLQGKRPIGLMGLSALLAARVLGPVSGVRVTFGSKAGPAAKHAAIMGADVRPCAAEDIIVDAKSRVSSTPGHVGEGATLPAVARAIDRLVRGVVAAARDRAPAAKPAGPSNADASGPSRGSA